MKKRSSLNKLIAVLALTVLAVIACLSFSACGVKAESITLSAEEVVLESKATQELVCTLQPENATVKVEISDKSVVKYEDNTLTAMSAGTATVKVVSTVDASVYAECAVTVKLPEGYAQYTSADCKFAYPASWTKTSATGVIVAYRNSVNTANINLVSEKKNNTYFRASADTFKNAIKNSLSSAYSINFTNCTVEKTTHAGYERVRVIYDYTLSMGAISNTMHQEQMILHSGDKTFILTVTYNASAYDETEVNTVFSEFAGLK
ncbi:MAG: Ig-like domain-containing protein [Clostridia bacterium]|nr:Ig-like domain-containing protein [Clostridia bacterium]